LNPNFNNVEAKPVQAELSARIFGSRTSFVPQFVGRELRSDGDRTAGGLHFKLLAALITSVPQGSRGDNNGRFV
jgi:hypothetical protein